MNQNRSALMGRLDDMQLVTHRSLVPVSPGGASLLTSAGQRSVAARTSDREPLCRFPDVRSNNQFAVANTRFMWNRLLAIAAICLAVSLAAQASDSFIENRPFISGEGGYHTYRIPAIARTTNGTLLAFSEGRKNSSNDDGDIDIVLRRSKDNGATWLPMTLVQEEGGDARITIGNPAPVVDETTGQVHLLFCRNNSRVFHTKSTDDGLTWSRRKEITASVKPAGWEWYATGPGHGIQLKRGRQVGRLVVSSDHRTASDTYGAHVVFSDDYGQTWRLGAVNSAAGGVNPNETLCVELTGTAPDGGSRIYFNTRDHKGSAPGTRGQCWSNDGGTSFVGPFTNRVEFLCPVAQGSVLLLGGSDEADASRRLLFSCPNHTAKRVMMSIWSSFTEAATWEQPSLIHGGPSAYSDLVSVGKSEIGLLYERGDRSPYETITFARFSEAWLDTRRMPATSVAPNF